MSDSEPGTEPTPDPTGPSADTGAASSGATTARGQRREAARAKARLARQRQKRRARGSRLALQGGLVLLVVAVVIAGVFAIRGAAPQEGPGPANMANDGITIGQGFKAEQTGALAASETPTATTTAAAADTVAIAVYYDYLCPICGSFEKTNTDYIRGLVKSGAATVTFHPIAILTNESVGTKYSNRAANAAACVATYSPDSFFDFNTALFAKQPAERTAGLTDAQLTSVVRGVDGMKNVSRIATCIAKQSYASWVTDATQRALDGPIAGSSIAKVSGTPTVLVNGQLYKYSTPFTTEEFSNFVVTAAGNTYATASPTPIPTAPSTSKATPTPKATSK